MANTRGEDQQPRDSAVRLGPTDTALSDVALTPDVRSQFRRGGPRWHSLSMSALRGGLVVSEVWDRDERPSVEGGKIARSTVVGTV